MRTELQIHAGLMRAGCLADSAADRIEKGGDFRGKNDSNAQPAWSLQISCCKVWLIAKSTRHFQHALFRARIDATAGMKSSIHGADRNSQCSRDVLDANRATLAAVRSVAGLRIGGGG